MSVSILFLAISLRGGECLSNDFGFLWEVFFVRKTMLLKLAAVKNALSWDVTFMLKGWNPFDAKNLQFCEYLNSKKIFV